MIMVDNSELIGEITKWENILKNKNTVYNNELYEIAFFKIFIKFEKFLSVCFEEYCVGNGTTDGYCPNRKLNFIDKYHLINVIKPQSRSFINHIDIIKISDCFFDDADNPFDIIRIDPTYTGIFDQMKKIRNFIAHESDEAKSKYSGIMNNNFKPVCKFLLAKKKGESISNYTYYIEAIKKISNCILNKTVQP